MFQKIFVVNCGEIVICVFCVVVEVGVCIVVVFFYEDCGLVYWLKVDEVYEIGECGYFVCVYLNVDEIICVVFEFGVDVIYFGYGFFFENFEFVVKVVVNGIVFIGLFLLVFEMVGNKVEVKWYVVEVGVFVLCFIEVFDDVDVFVVQVQEIGFLLFVKVVVGGGGCGMWWVEIFGEFVFVLVEVMCEVESVFGDLWMFLEQVVVCFWYIEVQIFVDKIGEIVYLFECDCLVQWCYQKVVEIVFVLNLDDDICIVLYGYVVVFVCLIGYENVGIVEFLLEMVGECVGEVVFIEMNLWIQVEYMVIEEVIDVDLVQSQMCIVVGQIFVELGLQQENLYLCGVVLQCWIMIEDLMQGFCFDIGKIIMYCFLGGVGICFDGGMVYQGVQISLYFDFMFVKLICCGRDFLVVVVWVCCVFVEFCICGVLINIFFLQVFFEDDVFIVGDVSILFIDECLELLCGCVLKDCGMKLLNWLVDVIVNKLYGVYFGVVDLVIKLLEIDLIVELMFGFWQCLFEFGFEGFVCSLCEQIVLVIIDMMFCDVYQLLLVICVWMKDLVVVVFYFVWLIFGLFLVEVWGGVIYDVVLWFFGEDLWEWLDKLCVVLLNIVIQMLLCGCNMVGYMFYFIVVIEVFVVEVVVSGVDIFWIFDVFNDVEQMCLVIEVVWNIGMVVVEVVFCYIGDFFDLVEDFYMFDYYFGFVDQIVVVGVYIIVIKDMVGLLCFVVVVKFVLVLWEWFDFFVYLYMYDIFGGQFVIFFVVSVVGVDVVDVVLVLFFGIISQLLLLFFVVVFVYMDCDSGILLVGVLDFELYWEVVCCQYVLFEFGFFGFIGCVYYYEIFGGQLLNLCQQVKVFGLVDDFEFIEDMYVVVDCIFGCVLKVMLLLKVVGDLVFYFVVVKVDFVDFEVNFEKYDVLDLVVGFMVGELGDLLGGWLEFFCIKVFVGCLVCIGFIVILVDDEKVFVGMSVEWCL